MSRTHQIFFDKLQHVYRRMGMFHLYGTLLSLALCVFLLAELPLAPVAAWFFYLQISLIYHHHLSRRIGAQMQLTASMQMPRLLVAALLAGLAWGAAAAFIPFVSPPLQRLLALVLSSIGAASLLRLPMLPQLHIAFLVGLGLPLAPSLLFVLGEENSLMVLLLLVLWAALLAESRRAVADLSELYDECDVLRQASVHDPLTGVPNRRAFSAALEREWQRARRLRVPLSLIMIDVDFFKKYNDRYGHPLGDGVLHKVAKTLEQGVRRANDLIARYGGEEFVILLFHTPRDDAFALAEALRAAVEAMEIPHAEGLQGKVTVSLGGATRIPGEHDTAEVLLQAADDALYEAKRAGRNRTIWAAARLPGQL